MLTFAEAHPLRTFLVNGKTYAAHLPKITECGALELYESVEGNLWTRYIFAPGCWGTVEIAVPTIADHERAAQYVAEQQRTPQATGIADHPTRH